MPGGNSKRVSFSKDSKSLAVEYGSRYGGEHWVREMRWDLDLDSWQSLAGKIANRNLTSAEWRQYFPDSSYRRTFDNLPVPPE
jgi:hypothetical protein